MHTDTHCIFDEYSLYRPIYKKLILQCLHPGFYHIYLHIFTLHFRYFVTTFSNFVLKQKIYVSVGVFQDQRANSKRIDQVFKQQRKIGDDDIDDKDDDDDKKCVSRLKCRNLQVYLTYVVFSFSSYFLCSAYGMACAIG